MRGDCDILLVGGGIVGLATAHALRKLYPGQRVALLEKEKEVAAHQTGHNSGVIHSGIYYAPGSAKARLCARGIAKLREFCAARGVPVKECGKLIVATDPTQLPRLRALHERGLANGVPELRRLAPGEWKEIEPHAAGVSALHLPRTAIVDYGLVARELRAALSADGVDIRTGAHFLGAVREGGGLVALTEQGEIHARFLVNCAGLHSDTVARGLGLDPGLRIIPFRGEYYRLRPQAQRLVRGLIYPVPDPEFPFLGVHFTRMADGGVEAGPNAVLALAREGYRWGKIDIRDFADMLGFRGFRKLARRYWRTGLYEMYRSWSKSAFTRSLARLVPDIRAEDLLPGGAGVRAQAVDGEGRLVDDFRFVRDADSLHVLNAPSPAATASFAIGEEVAARAGDALGLAAAPGGVGADPGPVG